MPSGQPAWSSSLASGLPERREVAPDLARDTSRSPARRLGWRGTAVADDRRDGWDEHRHRAHRDRRRGRVEPHHEPGEDDQGQARPHQDEVPLLPTHASMVGRMGPSDLPPPQAWRLGDASADHAAATHTLARSRLRGDTRASRTCGELRNLALTCVDVQFPPRPGSSGAAFRKDRSSCQPGVFSLTFPSGPSAGHVSSFDHS